MYARSLFAIAFAATLATPIQLTADEVRERRIDEIAAFLPDKPAAFGARIGDREFWDSLAKLPEASALIADAEKAMRAPIPECPDELYLVLLTNRKRILKNKQQSTKRSLAEWVF